MKIIETTQKLLSLSNIDGELQVIDGGCFIGKFSNAIAESLPQARILAYEPDPDSYSKALNNTQQTPGISVINKALGAKTGSQQFYRGPAPGTNSLLTRPESDLKPYYPARATLENDGDVDVTTIDSECQQRNINHINIMKLDLQGGELDALHGAHTMLSNQAVDIIITEAVFIQKYQDQPLLWKLWGFLEKYDYSLYTIEDIKTGTYETTQHALRDLQWNQCNVIFMSHSLRQAMDRDDPLQSP